jgi:DNA-binding LacI/PurR family transcriptional regulator
MADYQNRGVEPAPPDSPAMVTQRDIAKLAGVSQSVVSRVLGGGGGVSQKARTKVLAASGKVGYFPDAGARALVTGTSNIIALVVANITNAFYPYIFDRLTRAVQQHGREMMLFNASSGRDVDSLLPAVLTYKIKAAIVMTSTLTSTLTSQLRARGIQAVMLNRYSLDLGSSSVACDNVAGGRLVAECFLNEGFTRLAYIGGNPTSSTNLDRRTGFIGRLAEAGIAPVVAVDGEFDHDWGYQAAMILQNAVDLQAVFCADDDIAMGVTDRLRFTPGQTASRDVRVVGFDDVPGAGWPAYNLSTVRQPVEDMIAVSLALLDEPASAEPVHHRLPGTLIRRGSF